MPVPQGKTMGTEKVNTRKVRESSYSREVVATNKNSLL
jgi:hypothetical protein